MDGPAGDSLEGDGRQIRAFGAQQYHNAHAQEGGGVGVLMQVILDDLQSCLDVTIVDK